MKRLIIAVIALASIVSEAKTTFTINGNEIDAYQYVTNFVAKSNASKHGMVIFNTSVIRDDVDADTYAKCDLEFDKCTKIVTPSSIFKKAFPKSYTNQVMKCEQCFPGISPILLKRDDKSRLLNSEKAVLDVFNAYVSMKTYGSMPEYALERLAKSAQSFAVVKIRKNKMVYVGDEGKANIDGYVAAVKNSLNAYRLQGLTAAMRNIDMDCGIDLEGMLLTEAEVEQVKKQILIGDKPFDKAFLRTHLGVDKYNEFIKEYNGTAE